MKRFIRILGAILMGFNGIAVFVCVVNASGMIRDLKGSASSNVRTFLCMLAVYGALFVLGYKLYAHEKSGTARKDKTQSPISPSAERVSPAHQSVGQENAQPWAAPGSAPEKPREKDDPIGSSQKDDGETPGPTVNAPSDDDADMLPDIAYVHAVHHVMCGNWHQYDVLLDARPYGWAMMLDWAAYMNDADLEQIGTVTVSDMGSGERELVESYRANSSQIPRMPELREERGMLGIGGASKTLKDLVKIVWINQTNTLRLFTIGDEGARIEPYVETMARRTFGTPDAMKRGQKRA